MHHLSGSPKGLFDREIWAGTKRELYKINMAAQYDRTIVIWKGVLKTV